MIFRFSAMVIKSPNAFLAEIGKFDPQIYMKYNKLQIAKIALKMKNKFGELPVI